MSTQPSARRPSATGVTPVPAPGPPRLLQSLRAVRDTDTQALIGLIGGVFDEYPGCVLDLDDLDADLLAPCDQVARSGGAWWVLPAGSDSRATDVVLASDDVAANDGRSGSGVDDGRSGSGRLMATVGCSAVVPGRTAELKRLYVGADFRQRGLGRALVGHVEAHARAGGASAVELWSDTRFLDAHRLYERLGYTPTGETRDLHDPSNTTEYRFVRALDT